MDLYSVNYIPYSKKLWWSKSLVKRATARYSVAEKTLAKKHASVSFCAISVFPGIVLEISIDAVIACCLWWDGYLKVYSLWKP